MPRLRLDSGVSASLTPVSYPLFPPTPVTPVYCHVTEVFYVAEDKHRFKGANHWKSCRRLGGLGARAVLSVRPTGGGMRGCFGNSGWMGVQPPPLPWGWDVSWCMGTDGFTAPQFVVLSGGALSTVRVQCARNYLGVWP